MQAHFLKSILGKFSERLTPAERRQLYVGGLAGAVAVVALTCLIRLSSESYGWFERLSYDFPCLFKQTRPEEVRMVYMSEAAAQNLKQSFGIWNRTVHQRLIRHLKSAGAKAIFFDLVLLDPYDKLLQDLEIDDDAFDGLRKKYLAIDTGLHEAISDHGLVYFGAMFDPRERTVGGMDISTRTVMPPHVALRKALGEHWGLLAFNPVDSDYCVRRYFGGTYYFPSATWKLASELGAGLGDSFPERERERWLNYYGPPESVDSKGAHRQFTFDALDYDTVLLHPEEVPAGFFKGKIVFVGLKNQLGTVNVGKDEFRHPLSRWTHRYCTGVEIHATAFLNLLKHEWLTRLGGWREFGILCAFGSLLTLAAARLTPRLSFGLTFLAALAMTVAGIWSHLERQTWFNWSLPVILQTPFALIWGISTRYAVVDRRRAGFRRALASYLSEDVAAAMVDEGFQIKLGGENRVATIMFTDLEGFTTLSQTLKSEEVSKLLSAYFQRTNRHILDNRGAILRYMGDAILAVWNAPRDCPDHAQRACLAAREIALLQTEPLTVDGKPFLVDGQPLRLRTRVGIHTGNVIACNVGSEDRFDFTVLGDDVNLASRLEGLNKFFSNTTVLTTASTVSGLDGSLPLRRIGEFVVKGRTEFVTVFELLLEPMPQEWLHRFDRAINTFATGNIPLAQAELLELQRARPEDGPIRFYLSLIENSKTSWPVKMDEK